jgi:putative hydrolase of the HAD superfamily
MVSSLVGFEKPDPCIFQMAMQEASCPHEDILYVGDSLPDDVEGAKTVGLDVVLLDRFDPFPDADCQRIRSQGQLLDIVAGQRLRQTQPRQRSRIPSTRASQGPVSNGAS